MSLCIAINGRFQHRRISGVERYAHEISKRLQTPKRLISPQKPLGQFSGHLWEQFILPTLIKKDELLWSPANTSAWNVSNQVLTIHDASVFDHPEWFRPAFAAWTRLSWKMLANRAKAILTVSNFSRERLKFHLGTTDDRIHVVYNGVGRPFEPRSQKAIEEAKGKYGLSKPYFIFVGTNEPRKNLQGLHRAWDELNSKTHDLFIAGAEGKVFSCPESHASAVYIPEDDLPAIYSGATAFIFPSLYEGFGLPILEAMACGTPVIASDIAVFHEVFDDAVHFVKPYVPNEITNAMQIIIDDKKLANTLREQGLKKAKELTWDRSAIKTQALLESVA